MKKKKKRILVSILIMILLTLSLNIQVYALSPLIVYDAQSIVAAVLTSYGYSGMSAKNVNDAFNNMTPELQAEITQIAQNNCRAIGNGFSIVEIDKATMDEISSWYAVYAPNDDLPDGSIDSTPYKKPYPQTWIGKTQQQSQYYYYNIEPTMMQLYNASTYPYKVICTDGTSGQLIESNTEIYFNLTNLTYYSTGTPGRKTVIVEDPESHLGRISSSGTMTNLQLVDHTLYYKSEVPINIKSGGNIIGQIYYEDIITYLHDKFYSPDNYPFEYDVNNKTKLSLPYADAPDTNVEIPDNSIDNPVDLETVLAGYGSIDNFLEQGGKIILADGTILEKLPEVARSGTETLPNIGTGDTATDVSSLTNLVNSILKKISAILTAITEFFAISDFSLDFSPLKVNFQTVFPFCIPFDFYNLISIFSAAPSDFTFDIDLHTQYFDIDHTVDLSPFMPMILFFRYVVVAWFAWILISKTRDMIKW